MERDQHQRIRRHIDAKLQKAGGSGRAVRPSRTLALAILAILGLAVVAPAGQASDSQQANAEHTQQRALRAAQHAAEREGLRLQHEAERRTHADQKRTAREQAKHESEQGATSESANAVVTITCEKVSIEYRGFNTVKGLANTVSQKVIFKQGAEPLPSYVFPSTNFTFEGSSAATVIPISAPLGTSTVAFRTRFDTNGVKGGTHGLAHLFCPAMPRFTFTTEQSLGGPLTAATLNGTVGQTVAYSSVASNTGNTPMTFSNFINPGCEGTPGGTSSGLVQPHDSATFVCTRTLSEADHAAGFFADAASVTGTPEPGQGEAVTLPSNGVLISPIAPGEVTPVVTKPEVTATAVPAPARVPARTGLLGFASTAVPSLTGPSGCVRGPFTTGVKASGVTNVTFYLDGRRLGLRTAHGAKNGLIALRIDGAKLKAGRHRLKANITMTPTSPTVRAVSAWRGRIVRRCAVKAVTHAALRGPRADLVSVGSPLK